MHSKLSIITLLECSINKRTALSIEHFQWKTFCRILSVLLERSPSIDAHDRDDQPATWTLRSALKILKNSMTLMEHCNAILIIRVAYKSLGSRLIWFFTWNFPVSESSGLPSRSAKESLSKRVIGRSENSLIPPQPALPVTLLSIAGSVISSAGITRNSNFIQEHHQKLH